MRINILCNNYIYIYINVQELKSNKKTMDINHVAYRLRIIDEAMNSINKTINHLNTPPVAYYAIEQLQRFKRNISVYGQRVVFHVIP